MKKLIWIVVGLLILPGAVLPLGLSKFRSNVTTISIVNGGHVGGSTYNWKFDLVNGYIYTENAKVGIGTSTPIKPLYVSGGSANYVATFKSTDNVAGITFEDDVTTAEYVAIYADANSMGFEAGNNRDVLFLKDDGNIGIGTTSPDSMLTVEEGAHIKQDLLVDGTATLTGGYSLGAGTEYTIASGAITITKPGRVYIDTEGDGAADDLNTINGGSDGWLIFVQAADDARTVTMKNGVDNFAIGSDRVLDNLADIGIFLYDGRTSKWIRFAFTAN